MTSLEIKIPLRTCVICGRKAPQKDLLRLALAQGEVNLDPKRQLGGRGAYVCDDGDCIKRLAKDRNKGRIFRKPLAEEAWVGLFDQLKNRAVAKRSGNSRGA